MLIRLGYDIELGVTGPTALIALLLLHPDRAPDVVEPETLTSIRRCWLSPTSTSSVTGAPGSGCRLMSTGSGCGTTS